VGREAADCGCEKYLILKKCAEATGYNIGRSELIFISQPPFAQGLNAPVDYITIDFISNYVYLLSNIGRHLFDKIVINENRKQRESLELFGTYLH